MPSEPVPPPREVLDLPVPMLTAIRFTDVAQAVVSVVYRILVYLFLRWIPGRFGPKLIIPLYILFLVLSLYHDQLLLSWTARVVAAAGLDTNRSADPIVKELAERVEVVAGTLEGKEVDVAVEKEVIGIEKEDEGIAKAEKPSYAAVAKAGTSEDLSAEKPKNGEEIVISKELAVVSPAPPPPAPVARPPGLFSGLLGLPTLSRPFNMFVLLLHSLIFLVFLDSLLSPVLPFTAPGGYTTSTSTLTFARTGGMGPHWARIHVRYPFFETALIDQEDVEDMRIAEDIEAEISGRDRELGERRREGVKVVYRERNKASAKWELGKSKHDQVAWVSPETDWTGSVRLDGLEPATEYEYRLAFLNNTFAPYPVTSLTFVTFPDPRGFTILPSREKAVPYGPLPNPNPVDDPAHFSFVATSCTKPDFPYPWIPSWVPLFGKGSAGRNVLHGAALMAEKLIEGIGKETDGGKRRGSAVRFLLFLGDFIYADVPFFAGPSLEAYRRLYRNMFASLSFRRIYERIPVLSIYDDHEISNNYAGLGNDTSHAEFRPAERAWKEYLGQANPEPLRENANYYTFRYGDTAFFVWDTRRYRSSASAPDDSSKSMLGQEQKEDFLRWLGAVNSTATFKFIVSSIPFTSMWKGPDGHKDTWAAYMTERNELMDVMQYVPNVIVLSGDRHEFAATSLRDTVLEFSTSPLNQFYVPVRTMSENNSLGYEGEEKVLKYLPDGNVKWTTFEVDTRDPLEPVLRVKVTIDGEDKWHVDVVGKPVKEPSVALGGLSKTLQELLTFLPRPWF